MSSTEFNLLNFEDPKVRLVYSEVLEAVPEQCRECPTAQLTAQAAAQRALAGEVSVEFCQQDVGEELTEACVLGWNPTPEDPAVDGECDYGLSESLFLRD